MTEVALSGVPHWMGRGRPSQKRRQLCILNANTKPTFRHKLKIAQCITGLTLSGVPRWGVLGRQQRRDGGRHQHVMGRVPSVPF